MTPISSLAEQPAQSRPAQKFYDLLQELPLECRDRELFYKSDVLNVQVHPDKRLVLLRLLLAEKADPGSFVRLSGFLKERLPDVSRVVLDIHYEAQLVTLQEYLSAHQGDLLFCLSEEAEVAEGWFQHCRPEIDGSKLLLSVPNELTRQKLELKKCGRVLEDMVRLRCQARVEVVFRVNEQVLPPIPPEPPPSAEAPKHKEEGPVQVFGRHVAVEPTPMNLITEEHNDFTVQGRVVIYEERLQKSGRWFVMMTVTDYTDSVEVKLFHEGDGKFKTGILKEGVWVRVRGNLRFDKFSMDLVLMARDIVKVPTQARKDEADDKRVELHCHTQMSRMDGLSRIGELVERAARWGHKALAITDHGVVQAFPEAKAAAKKSHLKLILGMEGYLVDEFKKEKHLPIYHFILLVKNRKGLKNLYQLVTESHLRYFYKRPLIPRALLQAHREGLIVGSACEQGEVWQTLLKGGRPLEEVASFYDYIEVQPCGNNEFMIRDGAVKDTEELQILTRRLYDTGKKLGKPVCATGDSHFLDPQDEIYRRIIQTGMGFGAERQAPLYFKTTDELLADFAFFGEEAAREAVIENPRKVADWVEEVDPIPGETLAPQFEGADDLLRDTAVKRAHELYGETLPDLVEKRMNRELDAIIQNKYSTLYVLAMKLVKKSVQDGFLVGSRGSVGSSFVAFLTGITEVNPLAPHWRCAAGHWHEFPEKTGSTAGVDIPPKACPVCGKAAVRDGYNIAFEVFMGFKGDKMPDIDLNFSGEYQHVAHQYVEEMLGKDQCFRAGTISSVKDKTAFGFVKKYLEAANIKSRSAEVNRLVKGCSGVAKTTGQHPGGIVILPAGLDINDVCPVQYPADDKERAVITTHFDYDSMHDCLVKLDILGHDNPTSLKHLERMTGVNPVKIALNDPPTMSLFRNAEALKLKTPVSGLDLGTLGVPEFGTEFAMGMLRDTRPTKFEELVRLSGLAHGTDVWLGNAQDLIKSKTATLATVISTRDDMLSDLMALGVESALAFKIMEAVRKGKGLTPEFEQAMRDAKVPDWYLKACRKIKYIFPKAHAVAYCIMSFRIAYFKVHHPVAFYADFFSNKVFGVDATVCSGGIARLRERMKDLKALEKPSNKEKDELGILAVVEEMYARGFNLLKVDLEKSEPVKFFVEKTADGTEAIRPPLIALPGLGGTAAEAIAAERVKEPFSSEEDLSDRCGINKSVMGILRDHGCLGDMPESKQGMLFPKKTEKK
jgi:DNA polymerase III subunit alpha, Gram-positive type